MRSARPRTVAGSGRIARRSLLVLVGGTLGTAARAALESVLPAAASGVPWTTFLINVSGSFLLGVLVGFLGDPPAGRRHGVRLLLGTGVLGGYTTYSTFVLEVLVRGEDGLVVLAAGYALASVAAGVLAAVLGIVVARGARQTGPTP